jgi:phage repressor protein C with HTH and peptisase S24 domain
MNIGQKIKTLRESKNLTLQDVGDLWGISRSSVAGWEAGSSKPGIDKLPALARLLGVSVDELLSSQDVMPGARTVVVADAENEDFYQIPRVTLKLQAGITGFQTEPDRRSRARSSVPKDWVDRAGYNPEQLLAILVKGDSMQPTLHDGDTVIINLADTKLVDNAVYAVNYEGEAVVKRLARDAGDWWLMSDNPDQRKYHRRSCRGAECIVVGRVVRSESTNF